MMRKMFWSVMCITLVLFSACGTASPGPAGGGSQRVVAISAASEIALALMEDGSLWAWGNGRIGWDGAPLYGVGDGTAENRDRPVKIMEDVAFALAGHTHSLAITTDGTLWAWGANWWGQIGDGTTTNRLYPVPVLSDVVYAAMPQLAPRTGAWGGQGRSYAIRADGSLWAWGQSGGFESQVPLGDGEFTDRHEPVRILENAVHVVPTPDGGFALTADGTLWSWHGSVIFLTEGGDWNEAGDWEEIEGRLYPQPVMGNVASVSACGSFAITAGGELWSLPWFGDPSHVPSHVMDNVVYAASLSGSNFAITAGGELWAWGRNLLPSRWSPGPLLGDGTTTNRGAPVRIMGDVAHIAVMGNSAYAITNDGGLWEWGPGTGCPLRNFPGFYQQEGQMWEYADDAIPRGRRWLLEDDGGTGLRLSPVRIMENVISLAPTYFSLDHGWVRGERAFALTSGGELWAWGENDAFGLGWGLLGDGTSERRLSPVRIIPAEGGM